MAMSLEEHNQQLSLKQKSTHTMYRYHVNAHLHYTAVQLDNEVLEVLEVKGPHAGTKYATVEEWKQSIGATEIEITEEKKSKRMKEKKMVEPTDLMEAEAEAEAEVEAEATVEVAEAVETKTKKSKVKKTKVALKLDIPTKRSPITSTRWMRHVYEMMVEANVTITDEIIHAYNNVVKCLKKYTQMSTSTPLKSLRYQDGIELILSEHSIRGIFMHFEYTIPYDTRKVICQEIMEIYIPLYELIKDTVVPFMKNKHLHLNAVKQLEKNKTQMIQLHEYVEQLIKNHERTLSTTYRSIEDKRKEIKRLEEMVTKYSM
jgi:hypothetical protein